MPAYSRYYLIIVDIEKCLYQFCSCYCVKKRGRFRFYLAYIEFGSHHKFKLFFSGKLLGYIMEKSCCIRLIAVSAVLFGKFNCGKCHIQRMCISLL